jgi:hypothetical protein
VTSDPGPNDALRLPAESQTPGDLVSADLQAGYDRFLRELRALIALRREQPADAVPQEPPSDS